MNRRAKKKGVIGGSRKNEEDSFPSTEEGAESALRAGLHAFRNWALSEEHVGRARTAVAGPGARIGDNPFSPRSTREPLHNLLFQNRLCG